MFVGSRGAGSRGAQMALVEPATAPRPREDLYFFGSSGQMQLLVMPVDEFGVPLAVLEKLLSLVRMANKVGPISW